jgi:hypothetical protein
MFMVMRIDENGVPTGTAWDAFYKPDKAAAEADRLTALDMGTGIGEHWKFKVIPVRDILDLADLVQNASFQGDGLGYRASLGELSSKIREEYWKRPLRWVRPNVGTEAQS